MKNKYVYSFEEGNKDMKELLGGKGANLSEMTNLGLPVPSGIIVTTEACLKFYKDNESLSTNIIEEVKTKIQELEVKTNKKLGDLNNPLLLSIRSGSRASMPGMMDTVLNLGLNDEVASSFANKINNYKFVYDLYKRFVQMFSDVVYEIDKNIFDDKFDEIKKRHNNYSVDMYKEVIKEYKVIFKEKTNKEFPSDPYDQLFDSVKAVFKSWNNDRAITYRRLNDIPSDWGTAVNIQEMVYGNLNDSSGTGVAFTRDPSTGENKLYGEYLINAQGEDVVAGIRTPEDIIKLKEIMPDIYNEFEAIGKKLEKHYKDMQDMEFTIENNKLYILQTRNGKRTAGAALKIAIDLVKENLITKEEALLMVDPKQLDQLLHPTFDEEDLKQGKIIGEGLPASPGAATGKIYFHADDLKEHVDEDTILVRVETSPEDIDGMVIAKGILTLRGGMTSHAAVVARGMGKCCVSGCQDLMINEKTKTLYNDKGDEIKEGDYISLDGSTGKVYKDMIKTKDVEIDSNFQLFMEWVDEVRDMNVRVNADTKEEARMAREFGAEGIGLCRTEHMFFDEERIFEFRKMILSNNKKSKEEALEKLLDYQKKDFYDLYKEMDGYAVTIRYLDPPLHEFLPKESREINSLAQALNISYDEILKRIDALAEFNPMMGHRGVRLAITYPEIATMQTRAIIEASLDAIKDGINTEPELMIPLVSDIKEYLYIKEIVLGTIKKLDPNGLVKYKIGTMIETPRACIIAGKLSEEAEFFSFGTNDLTQMTYGFSRDDASKFLDDYYKEQIFTFDPFNRIDVEGVGELVKISILQAKDVNPLLKLGICGEHGGDPFSVNYWYELGLDYVSCSTFRIPIAKLALAQSQLKNPRK